MQTDRDGEIVSWIARLGAAGVEHVMARFGMRRSWAYQRLGGLVADGLLVARTLLYRRPALYTATAEGLRWRGLERLGVYRVGPGGFAHAERVASTAVALERSLSQGRVVSERELRSYESESGRLVGSVRLGELPDGRDALHRPDLLVETGARRLVAVEVELSVKSSRRLEAICRAYARARHLDHVYYLAAAQAGKAVARALERVRADDRITVLPVGEARELARLERGRGA